MKINLHRNGRVYEQAGNTITWKPGEPFRVRCKRQLEYLKHTNPVAFRELAEKVLVELVGYLVVQNGGEAVDLSLVQQEGAYKIGVSPETIKRYVFTHTASGAELAMVGKKVKLNPRYEPPTEDEE